MENLKNSSRDIIGIKRKLKVKYASFSYSNLNTFAVFVITSVILTSGHFVNGSVQNARQNALGEVVKLEGNLKPNELLKNAKYIAQKKVTGPESIVFDKDGVMYTGLANGQIVRVDLNGAITKIVQIGDETNPNSCDAAQNDPKCGRPLGLRIDKQTSTLYVADAFLGIFSVDLIKRSKTLLLSSNDQKFGEQKPKFLNDLDINGNDIYFVDSSFRRDVANFMAELQEAAGNGRLFKYNVISKSLEVLMSNLYFPNGLQLMPSKDSILINECTLARVLKLDLTGSKKSEVFLNLPGLSDNIRLTEFGTLLVPFALLRQELKLPQYGLLAEYDLNSKKPLRSWHDPTGKTIQGISQAELFNKKIFIGTFNLDYIGVVDYSNGIIHRKTIWAFLILQISFYSFLKSF